MPRCATLSLMSADNFRESIACDSAHADKLRGSESTNEFDDVDNIVKNVHETLLVVVMLTSRGIT